MMEPLRSFNIICWVIGFTSPVPHFIYYCQELFLLFDSIFKSVFVRYLVYCFSAFLRHFLYCFYGIKICELKFGHLDFFQNFVLQPSTLI